MYVCLQPLRSGFIKGCRPLIGVDGCHLKGAYQDKCLWLLAKMETITYIHLPELQLKWRIRTYGASLLEALELQVQFAEKRFCVRNIWVNFKLQFSGSTFKELFWNAARATTLADFEVAMESIKFLSEDAYVYLDNIPAKHWSRHAFSSDCKSNMLLNNVCETFNAVIRDARDKPILTQMEWMRRYMMKRHNEKWEVANKMDGKVVPYVTKLFERVERAARHYIVQVSRGDSYEVELNGDRVLVDIGNMTCTCYHWQLTGISCVHGFACILDKRVDLEDFVDVYYTRQKYLYAYEEPVKPMPGPKH
ncbi:uncharacterized protein LOC110739829 [Chenopodium quinoa]|uniref:uncharacterized protein LOC110739829 n=1 Tax=Chenopodium quinoa TaxID=63459 RepID=UPI000B778057|nr:uncharacterized protein LOC110739829 [Chenopodium quinoa]